MMGAVLLGSMATSTATPPAMLAELGTSVKTLRDTQADPWDDTVNVTAGSDRLMLVMFGCNKATSQFTSCVIDPGGAATALTQLTGSPQSFSSEHFRSFVLPEASFTSTGNKTLRTDWTGITGGGIRIYQFENASQTVYSDGANHDSSSALTVSVTRPTGSFPIDSLVYAGCYCENGSVHYTITGDVTEVDDDLLATITDTWLFAKGVLTGAKATVSATFTRDSVATVRKHGMIVVIEPA